MRDNPQIEALLVLMRSMSPAEISVLEASVRTPDSNMTTGPGSRNEALWTEMAQLGWIAIKEDSIDLPGGNEFTVKIYSITPEGVAPIQELLSKIFGK
jgi:hypothetical protein